MSTLNLPPLTKSQKKTLEDTIVHSVRAKLEMYYIEHTNKHAFIELLKKTIYADTQHDPIKTLISLAGSSKTRKLMKSVTIQSRDKHVTALCEMTRVKKVEPCLIRKIKKGFSTG